MRVPFLIPAAILLLACSPDTPSAPEAIVNAQTAAVMEPSEPSDSEPPAPARPQSLEDINFSDYSRDLAKYTGLEEGQTRVQAIENVRLYFAPGQADSVLRTSQQSFDREDGSVLIFSAEGFADEAIKGEEIYLILSGPKDNQKLAAYGSRIKCWRGENITEWQTAACP